MVLSFKLVEHGGEDWHELTHQIKRAVNSKGKCDNCRHLMTAEMLTKFFSWAASFGRHHAAGGQPMKQGIVNDAFHVKTRALVQSAIALLISCIQKGEEIPLQISETYRVTGPGGWFMEYEDKPDYDIFILHHEKEIEALPEFRLWMDAVSADPVVSRHIGHVVGTRHGMINRSAWEYVSDLLLAHFPAKPGGPA